VRSSADLDVDARFLLANERTLLAWVRTSLTLLAAGVGTLHLVDEPWAPGPALGLLALGALAAAAGLVRHRQADRALREGRLPATGATPALVAGAVAVVAVALTVFSAVTALS
jgi:putative membrane protein